MLDLIPVCDVVINFSSLLMLVHQDLLTIGDCSKEHLVYGTDKKGTALIRNISGRAPECG